MGHLARLGGSLAVSLLVMGLLLMLMSSGVCRGGELLLPPGTPCGQLALLHTDRLPPALACEALYDGPFLARLPETTHAAAGKQRRVALASRASTRACSARAGIGCRPSASLVARGLGVSIVPAAFREAGIQGAVLTPLAETTEMMSRVFAAWRQDSTPAPRVAFWRRGLGGEAGRPALVVRAGHSRSH